MPAVEEFAKEEWGAGPRSLQELGVPGSSAAWIMGEAVGRETGRKFV